MSSHLQNRAQRNKVIGIFLIAGALLVTTAQAAKYLSLRFSPASITRSINQ